jgi:hypothetical protein
MQIDFNNNAFKKNLLFFCFLQKEITFAQNNNSRMLPARDYSMFFDICLIISLLIRQNLAGKQN